MKSKRGGENQAALNDCADVLRRYNELLQQQNQLLSYDKPDWASLRALHLFIYQRTEMKENERYSWALRKDDLLVLDSGPPMTLLAQSLDFIFSMLPDWAFPSFLVSILIPFFREHPLIMCSSLQTPWTEKKPQRQNTLAQIE